MHTINEGWLSVEMIIRSSRKWVSLAIRIVTLKIHKASTFGKEDERKVQEKS